VGKAQGRHVARGKEVGMSHSPIPPAVAAAPAFNAARKVDGSRAVASIVTPVLRENTRATPKAPRPPLWAARPLLSLLRVFQVRNAAALRHTAVDTRGSTAICRARREKRHCKWRRSCSHR